MKRFLLGAMTLGVLAGSAVAAPVLSTGASVGGLTIYQDHAKPYLYYYLPGKLVVKTGDDGAPDVTFLILRYTGNATSGNSGTIYFHSYLNFRIGWENQSEKIKSALAQLKLKNPASLLVPMPVHKSVCTVVATALEGGKIDTISGGAFLEDGKADEGGSFTEKNILLCPDQVSSEALWGILKTGGSPISLNCELKASVFDQMPKNPAAEGAKTELETLTIVTDGVSVLCDATKSPARFVRTELGASAPKEYAIMQMMCFDFSDDLRPELFSKSVEIEATSVTGKVLRRAVRFRADNPAASVATFRFDAAVSLKNPYRYRVLTVGKSGKQTVGTWQAGKPWPVALDITTQPGEKK